MSAISAHGLAKQFGRHGVLRGLDLTVEAGSIYGLLGCNGAGKTTLLKLAMGLFIADAGEITVLGQNLGAGADKQRVGIVADQTLIPSWMSIRDALGFEASVRPQFDPRRVDEYLREQDLPVTRGIKTLSKGQTRRLDLEIALASDPAVLILDEPFDGLDPVSRVEAMAALVDQVARAGTTVLVSSHVLTDLERICGKIGVLSGGRIAFESDLDPLKESVRVVVGTKMARSHDLPVETQVIGSWADERGKTWLVRGLDERQEALLRRGGFQLFHPGLDDLGVELMRCLHEREQRP
jgi:ABC-2 type transport system ATP-binding protein